MSQAQETDENLSLLMGIIREILGPGFSGEGVSRATRLFDIGFDSVRYLNMMLCFEDIIDMEIDQIARRVELSEIDTVGDAVDVIARLRMAAAEAQTRSGR